jgi:flavin reductase (DIM6/NTAB) family NADH-FMN oxidoreductase RutF
MALVDLRNDHPTAAEDFRHLMACWTTGVAVVTSSAGGQPVGCTVNALASVSLHPPLLLVSLATGGRTLDAVRGLGRFGVNVLSATREDLAGHFAQAGAVDRFAGCEYAWVLGVPLLEDVVTSTVCVINREVTVADHMLVVAEPVWWRQRSDREPLVCFRRNYWTVSPVTDD